jgi:hypothetical protein
LDAVGADQLIAFAAITGRHDGEALALGQEIIEHSRPGVNFVVVDRKFRAQAQIDEVVFGAGQDVLDAVEHLVEFVGILAGSRIDDAVVVHGRERTRRRLVGLEVAEQERRGDADAVAQKGVFGNAYTGRVDGGCPFGEWMLGRNPSIKDRGADLGIDRAFIGQDHGVRADTGGSDGWPQHPKRRHRADRADKAEGGDVLHLAARRFEFEEAKATGVKPLLERRLKPEGLQIFLEQRDVIVLAFVLGGMKDNFKDAGLTGFLNVDQFFGGRRDVDLFDRRQLLGAFGIGVPALDLLRPTAERAPRAHQE